ncbi:MAG: tetratricopeptide repeat protein [candidate division WOR-3 bacterium]|nr:tetratricopeptide repeat protein [candidate division WOR-3 bacterium]
MHWGAPHMLYLLLALPVIIVFFIVVRDLDWKRVARFIEPQLLARIEPDRAPFLEWVKLMLLILGLGLMVIALARPRWGERLQMFKSRGVAVVIALDASKSMLAEDVKPNRLERARTEVAALLDELTGNAVGIVAFAGDAHILCPLTTDIEAAKLFLDIISPDLMPVPGTDYGKAILKASELFTSTAPGSRALVLITDGEDLGTQTEQAVQVAKELGVRIYPVAFSSAEGAPIPERKEGGVVYKKDRSGQVVISRMDERKLILIAQATGGRFYRMEGFSAPKLAGEFDRLEKEKLSGGSFSNYVERYQLFLLAGILLLFFSLALPAVRNPLSLFIRGRFTFNRRRAALVGFVVSLAVVQTANGDVPNLLRAGNGLFRRGKYQEALSFYQRAEVLEPDALAIHYNIGNTYYRLGKFDEAIKELSLATVDRNPRKRGNAFYNLGNSFYRMGKLDEAINSYKMALLANPNDRQAKENLEFCLKKKEEMKQAPDSSQGPQQQSGGRQQQQPRAPEYQEQSGMEKDEAERVLQAVENKERQVQKDVRKPRARRQVEKDW